MGLLGAVFNPDRILGERDAETGKRPGDPGGITDVAMGMGSAALGAAAAAALAPEVLNNMREAMNGIVSGGQSVTASGAGHSLPAVEPPSTPNLPPM